MKTVSVLLLSLFGASPRGEVLEFTSDSCVHCQHMAPIVARLQREGLPIRPVNCESEQALARRYGVEKLPTFVLVIDGHEVERVLGALQDSELRQLVAKIPATAPDMADTRPPGPSATGPSAIRVELGEPSDAPRARPEPGQGMIAASNASPAEKSRGLFAELPSLFRRSPKEEPAIRGQDRELAPAGGHSQEAAYAASVRLSVVIGGNRYQGSGTMIDSHAGRTLILTCGNLFSKVSADSKIEVELTDRGAPRKFIGRLEEADLSADVGLVSIPTDEPLPVAPIAAASHVLQIGDRVASFGASDEHTIDREQIRVTALNKYEGPDNIECSGVPTQGHCGGGLFNADGELIGLCIASGNTPNTGMYAGLLAIHDFLRAANLSSLFEAPAAASQGNLAALTNVDLGSAQPALATTAGTADDLFADFGSPASRATAETVAGDSSAANAFDMAVESNEDQEVVVIVRSKKSPNAPSRVMVIHRASPKLLTFLNGEIDPVTSAMRSRYAADSQDDSRNRGGLTPLQASNVR